MRLQLFLTALWVCLGLCVPTRAAEGRRGGGKGGANQPTQNSACLNVPAHPFDVVLGRPRRDSVTLGVLAYQDAEGCIAYGMGRDACSQQTPTRLFRKGEPAEVVIGALRPDTQYFYQLRIGGSNAVEGSFHTHRPPDSTFTFTITADSHLDSNVSAEVSQHTLSSALADAPDFHVDLGDTFMTEKHDNRENAARQYLAQRFCLGQLCRSAPLFLVLGNHDGESPRGRGSEGDSLALWSNQMRKRYFSNPVPDGFFTGDATKHAEAGLLQDCYAWKWGDALLVVLDPLWFTQKQRGKGDNWSRKLCMLAFVLCELPILLQVKHCGLWGAVLLIGMACGIHQALAANLFTTVTDMFPKQTVASVIGLGGMAGCACGMVFPIITGGILDHFSKAGSVSKGYAVLFAICCCSYVGAFVLNHLFAPSFERIDLDPEEGAARED